MNLVLGLLTLASLSIVHGQQGEKSTSIIPFPRIGRADRFFLSDKRSGGSPGLIPFPRIGRDGSGMHEAKRQLIPFPRVGKRPYWHYAVDPYFFEYEDLQYPVVDGMSPAMATPESASTGLDENDAEKRNGANGGGMWFGPRLGRKKRSIETESSAERSRETLDTRTLLKILHNFNWAIVPVRERRTSFTPRLGRSSEEVTVHHRTPAFPPRLGRSRDGPSGEYDIEEDRPRHSRSGSSSTQAPSDDSSTSAANPPFSPRLGRDHFSPRLGRSGEDQN